MTVLEGPPLAEARAVGALTLGGLLAEAAARHAGHEALVFDDPLTGSGTTRWTYADLDARADRVAAGLVAAGCSPGDRVGILMGNRPEAVASLFGAARVGAVAVLLSTFASPSELAWMLGHSGVSVVLTQTRLLRRDFVDDLARSDLPGDGLTTVAAVGIEEERSGAVPWDLFLATGSGVDPGELAARRDAVTPDQPGVVIYSSGTTANPKGMLHSQRAHALQFWLQADVFGRDNTTRLWTALPLFWTAGLDTAMGPTLAAGGCWVMQETFEPGEALALMARERVTEPYTLPHQTAALEEHPDWASTDLSALRCVFGKSAFARHPAVKGDPTWIMPVGYGLSETCAQFVTHPHDTPRELSRKSMGRLLPGGRLRVVDPETGAELGPDEQGELTVAGPTLMLHYVGKSPEECFDAEGFFHTGDAGFYDAEGYVHWTGRMTEMIKTGGANVSPAEIEVQLRACPPVKLARVMGVPDARLGQMVVLCAVLKDGAEATEEDIRSFLAGRLASYKVPKRVLFFAEGEIPMTGSDNKVRDAELAELVRARMAEPSPTT
ncbi:MAG TPA: class I adenylate-forming enzyme family protein [Acidimicrobiales bacterium]|nr:class I adenylate-forming enzyme family protein [Acidimicrobiales bacterium]